MSVLAGAGWMATVEPYTEGLRRRTAHWFVAPALYKRIGRRVQRSQYLLREWSKTCSQPYLSYSGGKDSTVMLHLARYAGVHIPALYIADTEPGLPEVAAMQAWWAEQGQSMVMITWGSFVAAYQRYGLEPAAIDRVYIQAVKEQTQALGYDGCARGLRAEESTGRRQHARYNGPHSGGDTFRVLDPMLEWQVADIWGYTMMHHLPYCQSYDLDDGQPRDLRRIGTLWGTSGMQIGRLVRLKRFYPEHYRAFVEACPEVALWA